MLLHRKLFYQTSKAACPLLWTIPVHAIIWTRKLHYCQFGTVRLITGRICGKGNSADIAFYSQADFWVFRPAGATRCILQGEIWPLLPPKFHHQNFTITNIIAPKGRVPCTILTKFTGFMRVLSLHSTTKFGCFSSINDKIINNLPQWGHFQPTFR